MNWKAARQKSIAKKKAAQKTSRFRFDRQQNPQIHSPQTAKVDFLHHQLLDNLPSETRIATR